MENNDTNELKEGEELVESMDSYKAELDASFKKVEEGDILTGTVIGVSDTEVILDLKYYTEGIIRIQDLSNDPDFSIKDEIHSGDIISATVIQTDDGNGNILLSKKEANDALAWEHLQILLEEETNITVKISSIVNSGVIAYFEGIRGFIPASKLSLTYQENLEDWLSKEIEVRVITVNKEGNNLVFSAKEILWEKAREEKEKNIKNLQIGLVLEGTVDSIKPYGAFIDLGDGLSGLLHISQISEKKIKTPASILSEGKKVKVKIISVKDGKISLSMKALSDVSSMAIEEASFELPKSEPVSTNLGSLLSNLKL